MTNLEQYWSTYSVKRTPETKLQLMEQSAEIIKIYLGRLRMFIGFKITQDTLDEWGVQGLVQAIDTYDRSRQSDFTSYLVQCVKTIVRNNCNKSLAAQDVLLAMWLKCDRPGDLLDLDRDALELQLIGLLEQLSEQEQLIFKLYYFNELTLPEISHVTGLTEESILQLFSSTLLSLKIEDCEPLLLV